MLYQVVQIHPSAPIKPDAGAVCNGCGVCCLAEPCPLGMVLSRKRHGACHALRWTQASLQYRCGALTEPLAVSHQALPRWLRWCSPVLAWALARLAKRWIAAGHGCDSDLQADTQPATSTIPPNAAPSDPRSNAPDSS